MGKFLSCVGCNVRDEPAIVDYSNPKVQKQLMPEIESRPDEDDGLLLGDQLDKFSEKEAIYYQKPRRNKKMPPKYEMIENKASRLS